MLGQPPSAAQSSGARKQIPQLLSFRAGFSPEESAVPAIFRAQQNISSAGLKRTIFDTSRPGRFLAEKRSFGGSCFLRPEGLSYRTLRGALSPNLAPWPERITSAYSYRCRTSDERLLKCPTSHFSLGLILIPLPFHSRKEMLTKLSHPSGLCGRTSLSAKCPRRSLKPYSKMIQ